jgi:hypothetical protein
LTFAALNNTTAEGIFAPASQVAGTSVGMLLQRTFFYAQKLFPAFFALTFPKTPKKAI